MVLSGCWSNSSESTSSFQNAHIPAVLFPEITQTCLCVWCLLLWYSIRGLYVLHVLGISLLSVCKEMVLFMRKLWFVLMVLPRRPTSNFMLWLLEPFLPPSSPPGVSPEAERLEAVLQAAAQWGYAVWRVSGDGQQSCATVLHPRLGSWWDFSAGACGCRGSGYSGDCLLVPC